MRLGSKKVTATMTVMFLISLSSLAKSAGTWSTSYDSPESRIYSLAVYNNKLYAGSTSNGIIYVYDGTSWNMSYDSPESSIYSLAVYNNKLYAGSCCNGIIYVYDGTSWNMSYDSPEMYIYSLAVYNNKLYAGTRQNGIVYVYDGTTWATSYDSPEMYIYSLAVYNGKLYAGSHGGIVYVYDGTTWATSYDSPQPAIYSLAVCNGKLYAGTAVDGIVYVYDGTTWTTSYDSPASHIFSLAVYNGKLYAGSFGIVYVYDGTTWSTSYDNPESTIYSLAVYNNKLYAGSGDSGIVYVYEDDMQGPITSNTSATPNPTNCAANAALTATVDDSTTGGSNIAGAEFFIDTVGANGTGTAMAASDGAFDEVIEGVTATIDVSALVLGDHTIYVHGQDVQGNWGAFQTITLTVSCQKAQKKPQPPSMLPTAQNHISQGKDLLTQANDLLFQAKAKGFDTSVCEKLISEATGLLDKAKTSMTNPIYANNLALQVIEKLKQAIDCLKALLG